MTRKRKVLKEEKEDLLQPEEEEKNPSLIYGCFPVGYIMPEDAEIE